MKNISLNKIKIIYGKNYLIICYVGEDNIYLQKNSFYAFYDKTDFMSVNFIYGIERELKSLKRVKIKYDELLKIILKKDINAISLTPNQSQSMKSPSYIKKLLIPKIEFLKDNKNIKKVVIKCAVKPVKYIPNKV